MIKYNINCHQNEEIPFFQCCMSSLHVKVLLASENRLGSVPSSSIIWKNFYNISSVSSICISLSLPNSPTKWARTFPVGRFLLTNLLLNIFITDEFFKLSVYFCINFDVIFFKKKSILSNFSNVLPKIFSVYSLSYHFLFWKRCSHCLPFLILAFMFHLSCFS